MLVAQLLVSPASPVHSSFFATPPSYWGIIWPLHSWLPRLHTLLQSLLSASELNYMLHVFAHSAATVFFFFFFKNKNSGGMFYLRNTISITVCHFQNKINHSNFNGTTGKGGSDESITGLILISFTQQRSKRSMFEWNGPLTVLNSEKSSHLNWGKKKSWN